MKELTVSNLTKTYGEKTLFDDISFLIHEKDRIGLVGINGTGKTSLLNILAEIDSYDGDKKALHYPSDYQIGYLSQTNIFPEKMTVLEAVFQGDSLLIKTVRNYEQALIILEKDTENPIAQQNFAKAQEAMNNQDAWLTDTNAKIILQKLGIYQLDAFVSNLSGGQQKRVGLAQVLIEEPDLLLLDEPTNHLDYEAIQWLEGYLKNYRGALLMVTHDRYFLDRVTNRIFELSFGKLYEYQGNYADFLEQKAERLRIENEQEAKRKQLFKQELAWMRQGAKARTTKQQARINRFEDLKENLHQVQTNDDLSIETATQRLGKKVLSLKEATFKINELPIITDFDLLIQTRERLGITGENGAGKSTLLNILAGRVSLNSGELNIGETVRLAYYTQQNEAMDPNQRLIAYLQEAAEEVKQKDGSIISVTEMLERFLFPRHMHGTLIGKLSGGEKRRLYLLKLLIGQPNVLLLDEPTNDLDIETLTVLEDYLKLFPGAVITVSHDRYFLDKVAEKLLIFEGNAQIQLYYGSINEYLAEQMPIKVQSSPKKVNLKIENNSQAIEKKKISYQDKKDWETIEEDISILEAKIEEKTEAMNHGGADFTKLNELQKELDYAQEQLEEKFSRWEYLSELMDN